MMSAETIELVETRLGQPGVIGQDRHERPVWSSIDRQLTPAMELYLTPTGLAGDQPSNTRLKQAADPGKGQIHGGPDKAVYVYPVEHYEAWTAELGEAGMAGRSLGENWRVRGLLESDVHIGDIWDLGEARLQISRVRVACQRLVTYFEGQPMIELMTKNGLCGWYMRVLRPGVVPTKGAITVFEQNYTGLTVAEAYNARLGRGARL
jgi:MOSC domain-containing protein YiiM